MIELIQQFFGESSRGFFDFFSTWGGPGGWLLLGGLVFWLSGTRHGLLVGFTLVASGIANTYLKWLIAAPRPYYLSAELGLKASDGFGMPSGHSQGVAAAWGAVAALHRTWWLVILAGIFILFTGLARIYYGVHSLPQVLAGWALGLVIAVTVIACAPLAGRWCARQSIVVLSLHVLTLGALIGLTGFGISMGLRGDYETPTAWFWNWHTLAEQIAQAENESHGRFILIDRSDVPVLVSYFWGYCLCGFACLRFGHVEITSHRHRLINVLIGTPVLILMVVLSYLPESSRGETLGQMTFNLLVPLMIGYLLPKLTAAQGPIGSWFQSRRHN